MGSGEVGPAAWNVAYMFAVPSDTKREGNDLVLHLQRTHAADETLADAICCDPDYKPYAEPTGTFTQVRDRRRCPGFASLLCPCFATAVQLP